MTGSILVSEVFSAIQGEGNHVGRRQVFLRLTGCNIRCVYCDQPEALERKPGPCRFEATAGQRDWRWADSPVRIDEVVEAVDRVWHQLPHHSISVTGGEPLMQAARLREVLGPLSDRGMRVHLETNGTLVAALEKVLDLVDEVSMDLKLPSVDGERVRPATQRRFLEVASRRDVAVKVVIGPDTSDRELDAAVAMVAEVSPTAPLFLQPLTPFGLAQRAPTAEQVLRWQERSLRQHRDVRVVPQTHKAIGQL